ncbi:MAG: hypothetical protein HQ492_06870 [Woeseiaceae bacterium]|nr:hypothetical protein [Woeseiaceae bacterium]
MKSQDQCRQESRTSRFNLSVRSPSKWQILDTLLASPMRLHRYRALSNRMLEEVTREKDCAGRK